FFVFVLLSHLLYELFLFFFLFFFFNDTATTEIYTLSLHDALPILANHEKRQERGDEHRPHDGHPVRRSQLRGRSETQDRADRNRSEEHTSELQSPCNLVCRLLLEKKKKI